MFCLHYAQVCTLALFLCLPLVLVNSQVSLFRIKENPSSGLLKLKMFSPPFLSSLLYFLSSFLPSSLTLSLLPFSILLPAPMIFLPASFFTLPSPSPGYCTLYFNLFYIHHITLRRPTHHSTTPHHYRHHYHSPYFTTHHYNRLNCSCNHSSYTIACFWVRWLAVTRDMAFVV